jgi:2-iminobutanoate/2-iminopropanoate deaminase
MDREEINVDGLALPTTHYAEAVRFRDLLFISGCAPIDAEGNLVGRDDVVSQTRQVLNNMKMVLEGAEASFANVVAVTIYLTDVAERPKIDPVRVEFFGEAKPASTLVEVSALAIPDMKIEIEAVAGL